jgi:hypothetical protein
MGAQGAAPLLAATAGGLMAHHLIDDPGRHAGVFQPGREAVPKVVGAVQIHGLQQRVAGRGQRPPTLLTIPVRVGHQLGGHEFAHGDLDRGWPNGPAVLGECGGAFADEVAFELGQSGEDMEHQFAARGGGVDRLLEAAEPDPTLSQPGDGVDQMPQGAAEAVELPDGQGVAGRSWSRSCSRVGRFGLEPLAVSVNTR